MVASVAGSVFAQDTTDTFTVHPKFTRLHFNNNASPPPTPLTQWQGSYTYGGAKYTYRMVGTRPSTGTSTTVPVYVIPVILKFTVSSTTYTFTPETKQSNGRTAIVNTLQSPIFKDMDWVAASGTNRARRNMKMPSVEISGEWCRRPQAITCCWERNRDQDAGIGCPGR